MTDAAAKSPLRKAAIACIAAWVVIWVAFMLIRFTHLDIRVIPAIGSVLLLLPAAAGILPLAAAVLAVIAAIQQPKEPLSWMTLGGAIAVLCGQAVMFMANKWM